MNGTQNRAQQLQDQRCSYCTQYAVHLSPRGINSNKSIKEQGEFQEFGTAWTNGIYIA